MFTVYKGIWWRYNKFETEDEIMITIFPYGLTGDMYKKKFPFDCYIMINEKFIVKEVVEV